MTVQVTGDDVPSSLFRNKFGTPEFFDALVFVYPGNCMVFSEASELTGRPAGFSSQFTKSQLIELVYLSGNVLKQDVIQNGAYGLFPGALPVA